MKTVLFVCMGMEATDRTAWSGIPFSIYTEMVKYYKVVTCSISNKCSFLARINSGIHKLIGEKIMTSFTIPFAKKASRIVDNELKNGKYDLIFVIGSAAIAYLDTDIPVVYFSDAVLASMIDYYWFGISEKYQNEYNLIQMKALQNADLSIFTSEWAKKDAMKYYNIDENRIEVIHFGANVELEDFKNKKHDDINLLFVGVDWNRKGADIAVQCVEILNEIDKKRNYYLHLAGCNPPHKITSEYVKIYGFLNRNIPEERKKLVSLREISDLFILPTKAECAGIVFAEAAAYSLPSIAFDTGGVGDYIINDITGYRLPMGSQPKDFAEKILELINDGNKLEEMKIAAKKLYEDDLNWPTSVKKMQQSFDLLIKRNEDEK